MCSYKFRKFAGKHKCKRLLKKNLWHRCFPVKFSKFLRTNFSHNTCGRLLLKLHTTFIDVHKRRKEISQPVKDAIAEAREKLRTQFQNKSYLEEKVAIKETGQTFFENRKTCPNFGKKAPDRVCHYVKFFIRNVVLTVSSRKSSKIYRSVLVPQNLPCLETFLVARQRSQQFPKQGQCI